MRSLTLGTTSPQVSRQEEVHSQVCLEPAAGYRQGATAPILARVSADSAISLLDLHRVSHRPAPPRAAIFSPQYRQSFKFCLQYLHQSVLQHRLHVSAQQPGQPYNIVLTAGLAPRLAAALAPPARVDRLPRSHLHL